MKKIPASLSFFTVVVFSAVYFSAGRNEMPLNKKAGEKVEMVVGTAAEGGGYDGALLPAVLLF